MSRNSFPPIQKRSSSATVSDLSGEMTVDQFLSKYSRIASKNEVSPVSRNHTSLGISRTASLRRTSIRRQLSSSRPAESVSPRPTESSTSPYSRSEKALIRTEHSSVLVSDLTSMAESEERMSNGDSYRSADGQSDWSGGAGKFQQSPSPDNRHGDKPPARRRQSLLERWEEVQGVERILPRDGHLGSPRLGLESAGGLRPSTAGSSNDSQFDDDAYPYRPQTDTRGSSQETGFEPTAADERALRPHSGIDSLATPRSAARRRAGSSSSTEASSVLSDKSGGSSADLLPPTGSLFDTGNVENIDEVIEAMMTAKPPSTAQWQRAAKRHSSDVGDWDQVDRASQPVLNRVMYTEPVTNSAAQGAENEYERYGGDVATELRASGSHTSVMERLSQILSTHRLRSGAAQTAPHHTGAVSANDELVKTGRTRRAVLSPRPIGGRVSTAGTQPRRGSQPTGTADTTSEPLHGAPTPTRRLQVARSAPPIAPAPDTTSSSSSSSVEMITCVGDTHPPEDTARARPWSFLGTCRPSSQLGSSSQSERTHTSEESRHSDRTGCVALLPQSPSSHQQTTAVEVCPKALDDRLPVGAQDVVNGTMTQLLVWRQVLKWTAVTSTLLTVMAGLVLLGFLLF